MQVLHTLFGTHSTRALKKIQPKVDAILSLESKMAALSDAELIAKTDEFRQEIANGTTIDELLVDAFAVCREASFRVLHMKHFPAQLQGGIILHEGRIAEMKTGEGKTLVATLPIYLNALTREPTFVVTVNDYLAERDFNWMGKLYTFLGLSVGLIVHKTNRADRLEAYKKNIVYVTNNELGFDYLRDNLVHNLCEKVQRGLGFAIVDEVDSVLIDDARTPLIISGAGDEADEMFKKADKFAAGLKYKFVVEGDTSTRLEKAANNLKGVGLQEQFAEYDCVVEEKKRTVALTEQGIRKAERYFGIANLSDDAGSPISYYITRALKARTLFRKNEHYIVENNKVLIVDENTGRVMQGRRYGEDLHQAIEAKEKVKIERDSKTLATITYQNFFKKFSKLAGMTGTALTEKDEFVEIYGLDVIEIPTHKPCIRTDRPDRVYITKKAKLDAILKRVQDCYDRGQPVLVGTISVEKSEELAALLKRNKIPAKVLNAKLHAQEAEIIAQAGRYKAVTIATNMAGRGTDIILGGNAEVLAQAEMRKEKKYASEIIQGLVNIYIPTTDPEIIKAREDYAKKVATIQDTLREEVERVKEAGGLYILGSERHESRRIDNQLRGRAGRQGDVGVSEFVVSLEDDLLRLFGGNNLIDLCKKVKIPDGVPIDLGILSGSIEKAQKRVESKNFAIRKQVFEYDTIVSLQRECVYNLRDKLLKCSREYIDTIVKDGIVGFAEGVATAALNNNKLLADAEYNELKATLKSQFANFVSLDLPSESYTKANIQKGIIEGLTHLYTTADNLQTDKEDFVSYMSKLYIYFLDNAWLEHLVVLDELKQGIGLVAYGQKNPLDEYKYESFELYQTMLEGVTASVFEQLAIVITK